jgi:hypothetical protein
MAKKTKALSGPAKRKYFRSALQGADGVSAQAAAALTARFDADITHMRVRQPSVPDKDATGDETTKGSPRRKPPSNRAMTAPAASTVPMAPAFDPHVFSLIVVMTKQGAEGLKARLAMIESTEHLRALALAQHVHIADALNAADDLRAAIIDGTAQRIADRRAAAS